MPIGKFDNPVVTDDLNAQVSLEELGNGISSNSNSQLNITQFDSEGNELFTQSNKGAVDATLQEDAKIAIWDGDKTADVVEINGYNGLVVNTPGHKSTLNSSSTPLDAYGVFIGQAENTLKYGNVIVSVYSSHESVTDGLEFQFSFDGLEWFTTDEYTIVATTCKTFSIALIAEFFRVKYTNGGTNQTQFILCSILRNSATKPSSHRIDDAISGQDDAELMKSVITGKRADGMFDNVSLTNGSNMKVSLEELENGISSNSNSQLNITQFDSSGNEIQSHVTNYGGYHLGVMMQQDVYEDANNSSTTNLDAGNSYTFTGIGTSTLGVVGLQWHLKCDQNATVYVEQSDDNVNWDISDSFEFLTSLGTAGNTVQAITSYWRIRVVLINGDATTYFRLKGILCPVAEPLPRALSPDERLKTESTIVGQQDRHVWISPVNTMNINSHVRLVGTNFDGTTKDTNFWTETVTNSGFVVKNGEIKLQTSATPNGTAKYESVQRARFVVGSALQFTGAFKFNDTVTEADNVRRCGAYDNNNGFFFQLDSGVFSVGSRKDTSDTLISSGSFNGDYGVKFTLDEAMYYKLDIEYTTLGAFYYINNKLLHKSIGGHLTRFLTLPIRFENNNDNGNATNVVFDCLGVVIIRLGELLTNPTYKYISGATTTILKYSAGIIHTVINNDNAGAMVMYDNTAGSGAIIASVDLSKILGTLTFDVPFNNGLTIVTTGVTPKITVTYE